MTSVLMRDFTLEKMISKLDIPDSTYEKAVSRYEDLGDWLDEENSSLSCFSPHIFSQGSFCLGTAIRPLSDKDEYDIDLCCNLRENITTKSHSQKDLIDIVKNELQKYCYARGIKNDVETKHRCLRIVYQDQLSFHMDIVPCIPGTMETKNKIAELLLEAGSDSLFARDASETTVLISDNRLPSFTEKSANWEISNPQGYAKWFKNKMNRGISQLLVEKADDIPVFKRKTPLQRVVQLLKRHRDKMFENNSDSKPISIIITTLAAHSYQGEQHVSSALINILDRMSNKINNSAPRVPNPVDPREDFADKWYDPKYRHLDLEKHFNLWLGQARQDFQRILSESDFEMVSLLNENKLGIKVDRQALINKAAKLGITETQYNPPEHTITKQPPKPWKKE